MMQLAEERVTSNASLAREPNLAPSRDRHFPDRAKEYDGQYGSVTELQTAK
jgi:hypothetical protein